MKKREDTYASFFRGLERLLTDWEEFPFGPEADGRTRDVASKVLLGLCKGDEDKTRALWKLITRDCDGYMPQAACVALIRAGRTENLVPDIEAPVPQ